MFELKFSYIYLFKYRLLYTEYISFITDTSIHSYMNNKFVVDKISVCSILDFNDYKIPDITRNDTK